MKIYGWWFVWDYFFGHREYIPSYPGGLPRGIDGEQIFKECWRCGGRWWIDFETSKFVLDGLGHIPERTAPHNSRQKAI